MDDFKTILLVEEDQDTRTKLSSILEGFGFGVECYNCPAAGLNRLEIDDIDNPSRVDVGREIDLVISSIHMNRMSGITLARRIRKKYPVLLMSKDQKEVARTKDRQFFAFNKTSIDSDPTEIMDQIHAINENFKDRQALYQTKKATEEMSERFSDFEVEIKDRLSHLEELITNNIGCSNAPGTAQWFETLITNAKKSPVIMLLITLLIIVSGWYYNPFVAKKKAVSKPPTTININQKK